MSLSRPSEKPLSNEYAHRKESLASQSPLRSPQVQLAGLKPRHGDRVTFGMRIHWKAACCREKVQTGRQGGCCAGIPHAKFVEQYRAAVEREAEKTGVRPRLDANLQAVLDGQPPKPIPVGPMASKNPVLKSVASQIKSASSHGKPPQESLLAQILMIPVRFIKWFWVALWEDLKLLLSTKKPE